MATILIVEDDRNMRLLTAARLVDSYTVVSTCDGIEALERIHQGGIDLIVADIMMPRMDGYELLKTIRGEGYKTPFLLLTAKESLDDKQQGFELGTDDYMTKPFSSDELLWRVSALLRRANISQSKKIVLGSVTVDSTKYAVYSDTQYIEFPRKEFELLFKLLSYPNQIFSKEQLLDSIWGINSSTSEDTIKTHVNRIRNRLSEISEFRIMTLKGLGYKADIHKEFIHGEK
ncbi:MAG: response regulator transcription factor [Lachnospiraceae bacterium]|nr:response regulator transcription factor [Lachnospiraceae bacterium]